MAKLTEKLQELGRASPVPLGFGRARARKRAPAMLVLGEVGGGAAGAVARSGDGRLDALIVKLDNGARLPESVGDGLAATLWGVSVTGASGEELDALHKAGCDFVLIESGKAPAVVLREDEMARGLPIRLGMSEDEARPLEDLPVDLLVLQSEPSWWPLTVDRLMHLQATVSLVSKHILLRVAACPPETDLPLLRDLPIDGLVVDLDTIGDDRLKQIRSAVDELAPRKPKVEKGLSPVLPRAGNHGRGLEHEHEEEDDDFDGDDE